MPRSRSRARLVLTAVLSAIAIAGPVSAAASNAGKDAVDNGFGERVLVGSSRGEPRIALGPDGAIYTAAGQTLGRDSIFKSTDGGATWRMLPITNIPFGGGDNDILVTPDNVVWVTGQAPGGCESVMRGDAGGEGAFVTNPFACGAANFATYVDRPWLAATERGPAGRRMLLYFNLDGTHVVTASDDGGLTWQQAGSLAKGHFPGNLAVDDAAGFVYAATTTRANGHEDKVVVYRSADAGATWTPTTAASGLVTGDSGLSHVYVTTDTDGNLYTAWTDNPDGAGYGVFFARSLDRGQTWSPPLRLSDVGGTHVFPAIDAGSPGRVVVVWYATATSGDPNRIDASADWHPHAASTVDGGRKWESGAVSTVVNHRGPLCTKGLSCVSAQRRLLDFLSVEVDPAGRANVVWTDDTELTPDVVFGSVRTFFARGASAQGRGVKQLPAG